MINRIIEVGREAAAIAAELCKERGGNGDDIHKEYHRVFYTVLSCITSEGKVIFTPGKPEFVSAGAVNMGADDPEPSALWREWQMGELPVPGMKVCRADRGNMFFTGGFVYYVTTVARNSAVTINGDDGVQRALRMDRFLEVFRPAV